MHVFTHVCRTYLRRLWPSLLAFWIVSISASLWAASIRGLADFPDVPLTLLEVITGAWLLVRIMQADSSFRTLGGWQVRPVSGGSLRLARWTLCFLAFLPALVLRMVCLSLALDWSLRDWWLAGTGPALSVIGYLLVAALGIAAAGKLSRGDTVTRWIAAGLGLVLALTLAFFPTGNGMRRKTKDSSSGSGFAETPPGLPAFVPAGDSVIDLQHMGGSPVSRTNLREILSLPAAPDASANADGVRVHLRDIEGGRTELLHFALHVETVTPRLASWDENVVIAIRYGDGTWGWQPERSISWQRSVLPGFPVMRMVLSGSILSPRLYPWKDAEPWDDLLRGATFHIFLPDPDSPPLPASPAPPTYDEWRQQPVLLPELPDHPTQEQTLAAVQAAVDILLLDQSGEFSGPPVALLRKVGSAAVPVVLESVPFPQLAWNSYLTPFLTEFSGEAHLPALLAALERDPQTGDIFARRNWQDKALPVWRRRVAQGLPVGREGFAAVARLRDPAMAAGLSVLALRGEVGGYAPLLRDHPGIEWLELVRDACRRAMQFGNAPGIAWLEHAAPLGDRALLEEMARYWLLSTRDPARSDIRQWIAPEAWDGEGADFRPWLRSHFAALVWDDTAKHWTLPAGG